MQSCESPPTRSPSARARARAGARTHCLLQAKIANPIDLSQTGRQDGRHVLILARLLPAYLTDLRLATSQKRMAERKFIEFLERLLVVITSPKGRKAFADLKISPGGLFAEVNPAQLPKMQAFLGKRLSRTLFPLRL
ncbi:MAG TPA: hypothetical protein VKC51_03690 [Lacunisphaera sp.]|nr:hypothetical protein [Lacunisphaera sp.]